MTKTKKAPARKPGKAPADWTPRVVGDDYLVDYVRRMHKFDDKTDVKALIMADTNLRETYYPVTKPVTSAQKRREVRVRDEASVKGMVKTLPPDRLPEVNDPAPCKKVAKGPAGKVPSQKKPGGQGIGAFIREMIQAGKKSSEEMVGAVKAKFPGSKCTISDINWNRRKLRLMTAK